MKMKTRTCWTWCLIEYLTSVRIHTPDQLRKTPLDEDVVIWDIKDYLRRLFFFCSEASIDTLEKYRHWFRKGVFKVASKHFIQLFKINALVDDQKIPIVYVVMQSKTRMEYERGIKNCNRLEVHYHHRKLF